MSSRRVAITPSSPAQRRLVLRRLVLRRLTRRGDSSLGRFDPVLEEESRKAHAQALGQRPASSDPSSSQSSATRGTKPSPARRTPPSTRSRARGSTRRSPAPTSSFFRAKIAQERLFRDGGVPYSIMHATQFFEFVKSIADAATVDGEVRLSHAGIRPMAADDVAAAVERVALGEPVDGAVEVAGPQQWSLEDLVRTGLEFSATSAP